MTQTLDAARPFVLPDGSTPVPGPFSPDLLRRMDAYWRAANYLSAGKSVCAKIRCSKNQ